jgi:dihydrofolate reductase
MSTLIANMSMSLDGFVDDAGGGVGPLFAWYARGDHATRMPGDGREFRTSRASARVLREGVAATGALVCGRRLFDATRGWGGRHPVGAPVFVVTHHPPTDWPHPGFTFVQDGVAAAVEQASAVAGEGRVAVASADVARQCLELGLLDEIHVDLVPVLVGAGKPWFAGLAGVVELEDPAITPGEGVTHLRYRVRRPGV